MRILHIDTERGWRGGERQALWLAAELERRGHYCIIAARPGEPLATRAGEAGLTVHDCRPAFEADPRAVLALRSRILESQIEVVHAHTAHAIGLGALATVGTNVPLVVSRRVDFHLRRNFGTRWKYGRAAAIIAISRAVAEILVSDGIDRQRITIVPDGTDVHRQIASATRAALGSLGVSAGAPLVVQVAQLVAHKDPVNFVRAIAAARRRVPGLSALLAGDGPLRAEVGAAVRELGLENSLHLAGYREDADALLAAADVVVLSSREEGMGSVLLDALFLGKPIVATRAGGIPEVIDDGVTGLLAPVEDPETLGAHVAAVLADPALAERLGKAARSRANDFSVERMTDLTQAVYERVATRGGPGTRDATKRRTDAATRTSSTSSTRAP
jgi:glycosyltransferase involved in cell wall biosynthesis